MSLQDLSIVSIHPLSEFWIEATQERLRFANEIPEDISERFRIIREYLPHCEMDEKRLRMAYEFAVNTFELSLRNRYYELREKGELETSYESEPETLQNFVDRLNEKGYLESPNKVLDDFVDLRNETFHPNQFVYWGSRELEAMIRIAEEIDRLYESPELREVRLQACNEFESRLEDVINEGNVEGCGALGADEVRVPIYQATLIEYENRLDPPRYWVIFFPVPRNPNEEGYQIPAPIFSEVRNWVNERTVGLSLRPFKI